MIYEYGTYFELVVAKLHKPMNFEVTNQLLKIIVIFIVIISTFLYKICLSFIEQILK